MRTLLCFAALVGVQCASCSGTTGDGGSLTNDNGGIFGPGSTLISTCGQICDNVLADCGIASTLYSECNSVCNDLILVPQTCVTQFAGYLACLGGATSINCDAEGQTIEIAPTSCATQEQEYVACNGGPSLVAACIALPSTSANCGSGAGEGLDSLSPVFCVGEPSGCAVSGDAPFGIGTYCCPAK